jgi:hypothetical protein
MASVPGCSGCSWLFDNCLWDRSTKRTGLTFGCSGHCRATHPYPFQMIRPDTTNAPLPSLLLLLACWLFVRFSEVDMSESSCTVNSLEARSLPLQKRDWFSEKYNLLTDDWFFICRLHSRFMERTT